MECELGDRNDHYMHNKPSSSPNKLAEINIHWKTEWPKICTELLVTKNLLWKNVEVGWVGGQVSSGNPLSDGSCDVAYKIDLANAVNWSMLLYHVHLKSE